MDPKFEGSYRLCSKELIVLERSSSTVGLYSAVELATESGSSSEELDSEDDDSLFEAANVEEEGPSFAALDA